MASERGRVFTIDTPVVPLTPYDEGYDVCALIVQVKQTGPYYSIDGRSVERDEFYREYEADRAKWAESSREQHA